MKRLLEKGAQRPIGRRNRLPHRRKPRGLRYSVGKVSVRFCLAQACFHNLKEEL